MVIVIRKKINNGLKKSQVCEAESHFERYKRTTPGLNAKKNLKKSKLNFNNFNEKSK